MKRLTSLMVCGAFIIGAAARIVTFGPLQKVEIPEGATEMPAKKLTALTAGAFEAAEGPQASIHRGHLMVDGRAIDPLGPGSYLWPQVSPDGKKVVFWCVDRGCHVSNIDGSEPVLIGGMRAAVWIDDTTLAGMYDRDNGTVITQSRLAVCDLESGEKQFFTPDDMIALFPAASPTRVAFIDDAGSVYYMDIE